MAQTGFEGLLLPGGPFEEKTAQKFWFFTILGIFQILRQNGRQLTPRARRSAKSTKMTL